MFFSGSFFANEKRRIYYAMLEERRIWYALDFDCRLLRCRVNDFVTGTGGDSPDSGLSSGPLFLETGLDRGIKGEF